MLKKLLQKLGILEKPKFEIRVHDFLYDVNMSMWVYVISYVPTTRHWLLSNGDECDESGWSPYLGYVNYRSSSKPNVLSKRLKYNDIVQFTYNGQHHSGYFERFQTIIETHALEIRYFDNVIKTPIL